MYRLASYGPEQRPDAPLVRIILPCGPYLLACCLDVIAMNMAGAARSASSSESSASKPILGGPNYEAFQYFVPMSIH